MFSRQDIMMLCNLEVLDVDATWPEKHSESQLRKLRSTNNLIFSAQYQQLPILPEGVIFKTKNWRYYDTLPPDIDRAIIYGDTAQKTKECHDFSVFQFWKRSPSRGIYLIDQIRNKWEAPDLVIALVEFWNKHCWGPCKPKGAQEVKIEDKSSGSSLIQTIARDHKIPISGIPRNTDKLFRALGGVCYIANGWVKIPSDTDWISDYCTEFSEFSADMSHRHDDQIDPTLDAIEDMLVNIPMSYAGAL